MKLIEEFRVEEAQPGPDRLAGVRARVVTAIGSGQPSGSVPARRPRAHGNGWRPGSTLGPRAPNRPRVAVICGVAAAALTAVAVTVALPSGARPAPGGLTTRTDAYVIAHVERALRGAGSHLILEQSAPSFQSDSRQMDAQNPGFTIWTYQKVARYDYVAAFGAPRLAVLDTEGSPPRAKGTEKVVNYTSKTWSQRRIVVNLRLPGGNGCDNKDALSVSVASPSFIRKTLACGGFKVAGRAWIGGVRTIKLVSTPRAQTSKNRMTLYVSPKTYLPVRMVFLGERESFQWLPATAANLAKLRVPTPPGFRHVGDAGYPWF
jgi:hypothetical protein